MDLCEEGDVLVDAEVAVEAEALRQVPDRLGDVPMIADGVAPEDVYTAGIGVQQPACQPNRRRLARAVWANKAEHLPVSDRERHRIERAHGAEQLRDAVEADGLVAHCSRSSASTGMPRFSTPFLLSTETLTRYTRRERSSAVWTLRGVNSACGEMKVTLPAIPSPPASV